MSAWSCRQKSDRAPPPESRIFVTGIFMGVMDSFGSSVIDAVVVSIFFGGFIGIFVGLPIGIVVGLVFGPIFTFINARFGLSSKQLS